MPPPQHVRRTSTQLLALIMALVGVALVVRMAIVANVLGVVLGVLFVAAGAGRFWVSSRGGPGA